MIALIVCFGVILLCISLSNAFNYRSLNVQRNHKFIHYKSNILKTNSKSSTKLHSHIFGGIDIYDFHTIASSTQLFIDSLLQSSSNYHDISQSHLPQLSTSISSISPNFSNLFSKVTVAMDSLKATLFTSIDIPEINMVDNDSEKSSLNPLGNDLLVFLFATIGMYFILLIHVPTLSIRYLMILSIFDYYAQ